MSLETQMSTEICVDNKMCITLLKKKLLPLNGPQLSESVSVKCLKKHWSK